ncbi:hypothetical protein [Maribellus maritimus]|uniref:hypothetical protein n=1 Tax=Maribellus maritimus TaxID=2870838 RepID=UPI001EEAB95E|nr:hypothetical protein [Maribellus maritimus]MCG6191082.1 hypothetical protein [Maribellus maritimus]
MKEILAPVVILLLFFSVSCEFTPSEIQETFVEQPDEHAPVLYIEVQPDMDTLKLASDVWTQFRLTSQEAEIYWVKIDFDDSNVYYSDYNSGALPSVHVSIGNYSEGLHYFTIQAFTASNSGSIADKVEAEGYLYEVQWPVIIHHGVDTRIDIKKVEYMDGPVAVSWEKYDYYNFQNYVLSKWSSTQVDGVKYTISNPRVTTVLDTTFLEGEYVSYSVSLNGGYSPGVSFDVPIKTPDILLNEEEKMVVRWNRTQNPKNLGYYHVALKVPNTYSYQEIIKEDAEDTVAAYDISPGFGDNYEFQVRYVPKGFDQPYVIYNSSGGEALFSLGNQMLGFENAMKIGDTENILLYNDGLFYKYNMVTHTILDSVRVTGLTNPGFIRISPDGDFFSYFTNTDFVMRKTSDWGLVSQFTTPIMDYGTARFWSASISDNYHLAVIQHSNILSVTDIRTGTELFRKEGTQGEYFSDAVINSEGDKILYKTYVYDDGTNYLRLVNFDGNKLTELGETTAANPGANYEIIQYAILEDKVLILKCISTYRYSWEERSASDFSLISSFDIPDRFLPVAIDFNKQQLVMRYRFRTTYDEASALYYDFEKSITHKIIPIIEGQKFVLSNEVLANGSGRYLPLNDLIQE